MLVDSKSFEKSTPYSCARKLFSRAFIHAIQIPHVYDALKVMLNFDKKSHFHKPFYNMIVSKWEGRIQGNLCPRKKSSRNILKYQFFFSNFAVFKTNI